MSKIFHFYKECYSIVFKKAYLDELNIFLNSIKFELLGHKQYKQHKNLFCYILIHIRCIPSIFTLRIRLRWRNFFTFSFLFKRENDFSATKNKNDKGKDNETGSICLDKIRFIWNGNKRKLLCDWELFKYEDDLLII